MPSTFSLRNGQWVKFRPTVLSVAVGAHDETEQPPGYLMKAISEAYHRTPDGMVIGIFQRGSGPVAAVGVNEAPKQPVVPDRIVPVEKDTGHSFEWSGGHTLGFSLATVEDIMPLDYLNPAHLKLLPVGRVGHLLPAE